MAVTATPAPADLQALWEHAFRALVVTAARPTTDARTSKLLCG